jgi:P27 family predicted phage terminase small subunit
MTTPRSGDRGNTAVLPPPDTLTGDARAIWLRLAPLVSPGRLTEASSDLFAMLCVQIATFWEAHQLVDETGILTAPGAELLPNPALAIRDHADNQVQRWAKHFGILPDATPAQQAAGRPAKMRHLHEA